MKSLRKIKSPAALATFGAFFVPEPLGACVVLTAVVWWCYRKLMRYRAGGERVTSVTPPQRAEPLASPAPEALAA